MGLAPRIFKHLFDCMQEAATPPSPTPTSGAGRWTVRVSMLEIYNEHLSDLLQPPSLTKEASSSDRPCVREDLRRGVWVEGLSEHLVQSGVPVLQPLGMHGPPPSLPPYLSTT